MLVPVLLSFVIVWVIAFNRHHWWWCPVLKHGGTQHWHSLQWGPHHCFKWWPSVTVLHLKPKSLQKGIAPIPRERPKLCELAPGELHKHKLGDNLTDPNSPSMQTDGAALHHTCQKWLCSARSLNRIFMIGGNNSLGCQFIHLHWAKRLFVVEHLTSKKWCEKKRDFCKREQEGVAEFWSVAGHLSKCVAKDINHKCWFAITVWHQQLQQHHSFSMVANAHCHERWQDLVRSVCVRWCFPWVCILNNAFVHSVTKNNFLFNAQSGDTSWLAQPIKPIRVLLMETHTAKKNLQCVSAGKQENSTCTGLWSDRSNQQEIFLDFWRIGRGGQNANMPIDLNPKATGWRVMWKTSFLHWLCHIQLWVKWTDTSSDTSEAKERKKSLQISSLLQALFRTYNSRKELCFDNDFNPDAFHGGQKRSASHREAFLTCLCHRVLHSKGGTTHDKGLDGVADGNKHNNQTKWHNTFQFGRLILSPKLSTLFLLTSTTDLAEASLCMRKWQRRLPWPEGMRRSRWCTSPTSANFQQDCPWEHPKPQKSAFLKNSQEIRQIEGPAEIQISCKGIFQKHFNGAMRCTHQHWLEFWSWVHCENQNPCLHSSCRVWDDDLRLKMACWETHLSCQVEQQDSPTESQQVHWFEKWSCSIEKTRKTFRSFLVWHHHCTTKEHKWDVQHKKQNETESNCMENTLTTTVHNCSSSVF